MPATPKPIGRAGRAKPRKVETQDKPGSPFGLTAGLPAEFTQGRRLVTLQRWGVLTVPTYPANGMPITAQS